MTSDIRLLEELVEKAAERLRRVSEERGRLEQEVQALRERVSELERVATAEQGTEAAWQAERAEVVDALRETLADLRGT